MEELTFQLDILEAKIKTRIQAVTTTLTRTLTLGQHTAVELQAKELQSWLAVDHPTLASKIRKVDADNAATLRETHKQFTLAQSAAVEQLLLDVSATQPASSITHPAVSPDQ